MTLARRCLVADDHEAFLATVVRHLEPHFEVITTAGDGQAALDETIRVTPDVIVLDTSMPRLSGLEAATKLRARGSAAKIIFLTVQTDAEYVRAALETGALRNLSIRTRQ